MSTWLGGCCRCQVFTYYIKCSCLEKIYMRDDEALGLNFLKCLNHKKPTLCWSRKRDSTWPCTVRVQLSLCSLLFWPKQLFFLLPDFFPIVTIQYKSKYVCLYCIMNKKDNRAKSFKLQGLSVSFFFLSYFHFSKWQQVSKKENRVYG